MTTQPNHPIGRAALIAFCLYVTCTLIGMAPMNLAFGLVLAVYLYGRYTGAVLSFSANTIADAEEIYFRKQYKLWAWVIFFACVLSLVVADFFPLPYAGHVPEITLHGYTKIWYMIVPLILVQTFTLIQPLRFENFRTIIRVWGTVTLLLGVVAVIQFNTGWPKKQLIPMHTVHYHAILFLGHHLSTASIFIFPAFTALAVAVGSLIRHKKLLRFETSVALVGILILFLSYARTAWLSLPIGIILVCVHFLNRKQFAIFLAGFIASLALLTQTSALKERIVQGFGVSERIDLWKANIDFFLHRPFTGIGWLKTQEMSEFYFLKTDPGKHHFWGHAHNNFFEMLGGTGLIGVIAFIAWTLFTFRLAVSTSKKALAHHEPYWSDFAWGIFVALMLLHINGLTNVTFWEGKVMHQQMLGVGMLLILQRLLKPSSSS